MTARGKLQPLEKDIQKAICDYLTLRGIFHWRANTSAFAMPATATHKRRFIRNGFPGCADIIGIVPKSWGIDNETKKKTIYSGQFMAIECKRPGGKLTDDQLAFLMTVERNGGLAIVARCLDDVIKALG